MKKLITVFLLIVISSGFAEEDPVARWKKIEAEMAIVDRFALQSAEPFYGKSLEEVRSFDSIEKETTKLFETSYGDSASNHEITFKGLLIKGFYISGKGFFITYMNVTGPNYSMPQGLNVGEDFEKIHKVMKQNGEKEDNTIAYRGETEQVIFHQKDGGIERIELFLYTG